MEKDLIKTLCQSLIKTLEARLHQLEGYREMDIDKEILDTVNELNKYKKILRELYDEN